MKTINIPIYGNHKTKVEEGKYEINPLYKLYEIDEMKHNQAFFIVNSMNFIKASRKYYKENHITYKPYYDDYYEEYLDYALEEAYDELFSDEIEYADIKQTEKETAHISTI